MPRTARLPVLLAALCAVALAAGCRREEPALTEPEDIIGRMLERVQADFGDVQNFTVVADSHLVYFERVAGTDSLPTFRHQAAANDAAQTPVPDPYYLPVPATLAQLRTMGRLAGEETLDGRRVYAVEAARPREFLGLSPAGSDSGYAVRLYVDAATFRVAALRVQQPPPPGAPNPAAGPLVQTVRYEDYREADGLALPRRTRVRIEGLRAITPEEERMVMGGNLALARAQAEQMPPAERARQLAEIDRQIRFFNEGVLTGTFTVREVRVGAGSPFTGAAAAPPPAAP